MSSSSARDHTVTVVVFAAVAVLAALFVCLCCLALGVAAAAYLLTQRGITPPEPTPSLAHFGDPPGADLRALDRAMVQRLNDTPTSDTNYWVLHGQLRSKTGDPARREAVQPPTEYQAGDMHVFWMSDEEEHRYWQITATLRIKTAHAYLYVDQDTSYNADDLSAAAELFEDKILPNNHSVFGTEWNPGIDNDPRITILVTRQMPVRIAGYFSTGDEYPIEMKPYSNQREMIYVTSGYLRSLDMFGQLLSHEFQHMIHWNQDQSEALWINEGLSLLAEEINGYKGVLGDSQFWRDPDVQLTNWAEDPNDRYRNYAASKLFLSYLGEHYGGYPIMSRLTADDAYGIDGVERLLSTGGYAVQFEQVFGDWAVANLLNDPGLDHGQYGYALRRTKEPRVQSSLRPGIEHAGWVRQFGADYVEIRAAEGAEISFEGSQRVRLTGTDPHQGNYAWWSNRRNMLSSSLTREVDLRGVGKATLRFWAWYDMEEHFDYAYVMVSLDQGRTWKTLPGTHTTVEDPNKASYGHAYTGKSEAWLQEQVDLSPYGGNKILLRFWYIGDPGLNQPGWLVDEISIPEVGFADDAESQEGGWVADGFVRSSNYLPQTYIVQLAEYGPQTTVRHLDLDKDNHTRFRLGDGVHRAMLIVSGGTRWTSEPAPYRIRVVMP